MNSDLSPQDILSWASARRQSRRDPATGNFNPIRFTSPGQERQEWLYGVIEIDASIAEYRQWLAGLVPGTAFAERKQPLYWDRIVELEQFKKELLERIRELDAVVAKDRTSVLR